MTGKVISIHSSRGGTGKSVIAINLALTLLKKGFNSSILDLDFRAPSLYSIFNERIERPVKYWLNDFFNGNCEINRVLMDVSESFDTDKKFLIGLADPSMDAIRKMMDKSRAWEASALKKLFSLRSILLNDMNVDFVIYDTSPGIQYSSINAIISSDLSIVVTTSDALDIEGVKNMLSEFYDIFEKKTLVLMNKVFPETDAFLEDEEKELMSRLEETLGHSIVGLIPCYCDVLKAKRSQLLIFEKPNHPFLEKIEKIAQKILRLE